MKAFFEKSIARFPLFIRRAFLSWLIAAAVEHLMVELPERDLHTLAGISQMSGIRMLLVGIGVFAVLTLLGRVLPANSERWCILAAVEVLFFASITAGFSTPFAIACLLILTLLSVYVVEGWQQETRSRQTCAEQKGFALGVGLGAIAFFALVSVWTVGRVNSFSTPTYDFGIFSQMFHSMKTTGLPTTTLERNGPLSHFAVHVSPIYYLMLPFYWLVSKPATLQVLQAAVLASAVIPLWKLGKHHGLSPLPRMLLCLLLLLYPAYAGGTSYDLHENAFLTPLILWLFYGIDRENVPVTAVSAVLTLMVKEDAAVYVAVVGLYLLIKSLLHKEKWGMAAGCALLAGSLIWFVAVTGYLASKGDGVMTYRYKNFMFDGSDSLATVIKAVLLCPMKAVFECADAEKLKFIGLTMLPLAFLPLLTRRYERLLLLIPYVLVNLMSDYQYQHDIFFQYTYGATACLFYLTLVNLADWKKNWTKLMALALAIAVAGGCFAALVLPKALSYPEKCKTYQTYYERIREVLDKVPDGASVAATTFYTTYLSQRDALYDIHYASADQVFGCEYLVLGVTDSGSFRLYQTDGENGYENFVVLLRVKGFEKIAEYEGKLEIYRKAP